MKSWVMPYLNELMIEAEPNNLQQQAARIIDHYGTAHQLVKLCKELIQQAAKCYEHECPYNSDFVEELADMRVMLMQFEAVLGRSVYWSDLYTGMVQAKIKRIESEKRDF